MSMKAQFRLRSCQRCGGDAYLDVTDGPEWYCLQCARPVSRDASMYGLVASTKPPQMASAVLQAEPALGAGAQQLEQARPFRLRTSV